MCGTSKAKRHLYVVRPHGSSVCHYACQLHFAFSVAICVPWNNSWIIGLNTVNNFITCINIEKKTGKGILHLSVSCRVGMGKRNLKSYYGLVYLFPLTKGNGKMTESIGKISVIMATF